MVYISITGKMPLLNTYAIKRRRGKKVKAETINVIFIVNMKK